MTLRTVVTDRVLIGERWGAVFSECGRYRYRLWREWDTHKPTLAFCMLNPSTADHMQNDPTIERCQRRARAMRYGRLEIVNIFALRSTDPRALYEVADPVGPGNIEAIVAAVNASEFMVCGWGTHGKHCGMGPNIKLRMQQFYPHKLRVLAVNKDGSPKHPLYVGYDVQPKEWT